MISVLNFKPYENGHIRGFFDLRYHGLTIKSCRLMAGNNGLWFSFPQVKGEEDGEVRLPTDEWQALALINDIRQVHD